MYIPEEKISEILNTSDIVDIVSEAVILKKSGRNFFGLCPFHSEKTPSFSVNPAKQIFYCFGCGAGGNALVFTMKYHGITFPEAARMVARRYNIVLETQAMDPAALKRLRERETLFKLNQRVMDFYQRTFQQDSGAARARQYLEKRGLSKEMIDRFKLGFSKDRWDSVVTFFKQSKVSRSGAVQSGLILKKEQKEGYYDRFRNRVMFPIFDINMQVAGFGGRVMDDSKPKYLNSPETPVYSKSRILYGLHAAKQACRQKGVLHVVEGYFDFLTLFQHGIENTVASLGTALTTEHIRIIKGYAQKIILVFDSDAAGINAARKSIRLFAKEGMEPRVLVLPEGHDPDSFVSQNGKRAFLELADNARSVMQFLLKISMDTHGRSVDGRINVLNDMKPHLSSIQDSARRSLHIKELAETLGIDEKAVLEKVRDQAVSDRAVSERAGRIPAGETPEIVLASDPREKQMLAMMLGFPEILAEVDALKVLDCFYSDRLRRLGLKILDVNPGSDRFVTAVMASLEADEDQALLASLAMDESVPVSPDTDDTGHVRAAARALMNRIVRVRKKEDNALNSQIMNAEQGNDPEMLTLLKQKQAEIRQLHGQ